MAISRTAYHTARYQFKALMQRTCLFRTKLRAETSTKSPRGQNGPTETPSGLA